MNKPQLRSQKEISQSQKPSFNGNFPSPQDRINQRKIGNSSPTFGFEEMDEAINYYLVNIIKPQVLQNGILVDVPVVYGTPERWKSIQKEGYYRDKATKIEAPLLMFKRTDQTKNRLLSNKIDGNYPHNYFIVEQTYNKNNFYDNFSVLTNRKPTKSYELVVVPDWFDITYSCIVMTYYMDQLNKIVEAIGYSEDSYWGEPERYKFKARINNFNTPTELVSGEMRSVRANFELKIFGYVIPNNIQKHINSLKQLNSLSKITIQNEVSFKSP